MGIKKYEINTASSVHTVNAASAAIESGYLTFRGLDDEVVAAYAQWDNFSVLAEEANKES